MGRGGRATVVATAAALVLSGCASPLVARISSTDSVSSSPTASATPAQTRTPSRTPSPSPTPSDEPALVTPSPDVTLPGSDSDLVPVVHRVNTKDRVVFITIDDGYQKDPAVVALLKARHVPITSFLAVTALQTDHQYFGEVQTVTGQRVQDHTMTHPFLSKLSYEKQREEICGAADQLGAWYGERPWLFRPPYGDYSRTTRRAAKDCGMTALVLWDVSLPHRVLRYSGSTHLQPGDIVLIHWRPGLARDLPVVLDAAAQQGLRIAALQDYLPRPS